MLHKPLKEKESWQYLYPFWALYIQMEYLILQVPSFILTGTNSKFNVELLVNFH